MNRAPIQIRLPGYYGEGYTLLEAAGGSYRRAARALIVTFRGWWYALPPFDRRRVAGEGPDGREKRGR